MENKKKYIIAIILFIFLGLMIFTFANPSEEDGKKLNGNGNNTEENSNATDNENNTDGDDNANVGNNNQNNNNVTNNVNPVVATDNSYNLALQAVINAETKIDEDSYDNALDLVNKVTNNNQKEELQTRLDEVKDGIDAKALVEELENQVDASANKSDMDAARGFRTDEEVVEKVNSLTNETLKQSLLTRLNTLATVLDDTTSPVVNIANGAVLSQKTEILIEDDNEVVITIQEEGNEDSNEIPNGYMAEEGTYVLTVMDEAFNETAVTFTIDLSDPEFNVTNGSHSTEAINVSITDRTFKYVEIYNQDANTIELSSDSEFTLDAEATYRLTAFDEAGHSTVRWVAIDKTLPTVTGVENNKHYKDAVEVTIEDKFLTKVLINDEEQDGIVVTGTKNEGKTLVKAFTEEGTYVIEATDKVGNTTTITFTIDKTKPVINNVEDGKYYNVDVTPEVVEENFKNATLKLNGEHIKSYKVGDTLTKEGTYTLVVTDKAMNKSTRITFVIDKTLNEPTITYSTTELTNRSVIVTLTADEEVEVLYAGTWNPSKGFATVFKKSYPSNTTQEVTVRDKAGNEKIVKVVINNIDKSAPQPVSTTYSPKTLTNGNVTVTIRVNEELKPVEGWTLSEDKKAISREFSENVNGNVTISDLAGNTVVRYYSIKNIDKVAPQPVSTTYSPKTLTNGNVTVTIRVNEELKPVEGWTLSEDKKAISREFSENVNGNVTISDLAGNTVVRYYSIKNIDKVAPTAEITMSNNNGYTSTNQDVTVTLKTNEEIVTPEGWTEVVAGTEFTKVYSENGKHSLTITDKAGNQTTVNYEVKRIDKVAPVVTVVDPNRYQLEVGSTYVDKGYSAWDEVDKDVTNLIKITYQFQAQGTSSWPFVDSLDTNKLGTYKVIYTAYDKAGNTAKGTRVVQIVDTIAPTITAHSLVGTDPYYSQISFKLSDNHLVDKFVLNDVEFDRTNAKWSDANYQNIKSALKNGENVMVLYDVAGNTTEYKFSLDLVAPTLTVKKESTKYGEIYTKISFQLSDNNLIDKFVLNGKEFDRTNAKYSDANYDNIKSAIIEGTNTIVLYDVAGNSTTQTFEATKAILVSTFEELKAAFATGGNVKLLNDIVVEEILVQNAGINISLDMNGKKLTIKDASVDPMIDMKTGSSLTITGNGTVDLEDNYYASFILPRGDVTIENGNFLRDAGGTGYGSYFVGISGGKGKLIIKDGYFDFGYYKEGDWFENSRRGLNLSWGQYVRVYGGTFVGQNPAWGDEGMALTNPDANTGYCQGVFFEGQQKTDTEIPSTYKVTEGTHKDGRPTYKVTYTPSN